MNKNYQGLSWWWVLCVGILTLIILSSLIFWTYKNSPSSKTNRQLALTCTTDMATQFHIHTNLEIIINGQKQEIPTDVGINNGCMNSLHTHDNSGKIHIESPEKRDFNLSDFFAVWNKTYNKNQILDYRADQNHIIWQTVNGNIVQDYENTVFRDEDKIIINYETKN